MSARGFESRGFQTRGFFVGAEPPPPVGGLAWLANANIRVEGNMLKNVAGQTVAALLLDTDGAAVTAGTTTVYVTGDGGTQASAGTANHEGNGAWSFLPSQANTNFDGISFLFVNSGAVSVERMVYTDQSYDRIGAPAGASVSADIAVIESQTDDIGIAGAGLTALGGMSTAMKAEVKAEADTALTDYDGPTNAEMVARTLLAASYFDPSVDAVANVTLVDTTTNNTDMRGTDGANTTAPDNAGIAAIELDTGVTIPAQIAALNDVSVTEILTTQMTEAYAADGTAPTLAQALFMVQQMLGDFSIAGTTLTMRRLDGSTTAATFTLDDGTDPTAISRAS